MSEIDARRLRLEALAGVLDRHVTDAAFESGCRLSCGYDGDDLTEHMAAVLLDSDALRALLAEAWDEGWTAGCNDQQYGDENAQPWTPNPHREQR